MDVLSSEISDTVFRRVNRVDLAEFSLDSRMLSILVELDGKKSLAVIAQKTGLNSGSLEGLISKLLRIRLIEPVEDTVSLLDGEFFEYLGNQLCLAIGPIAGILIEEAVGDLGYDRARFPSQRAAELVDTLARQIRRKEKRFSFQKAMVRKIRERGE